MSTALGTARPDECPVCGGRKLASHLACRTCWRRVPAQLKAEVLATCRVVSDGRVPDYRAAFNAYRHAADAAIAASKAAAK